MPLFWATTDPTLPSFPVLWRLMPVIDHRALFSLTQQLCQFHWPQLAIDCNGARLDHGMDMAGICFFNPLLIIKEPFPFPSSKPYKATSAALIEQLIHTAWMWLFAFKQYWCFWSCFHESSWLGVKEGSLRQHLHSLSLSVPQKLCSCMPFRACTLSCTHSIFSGVILLVSEGRATSAGMLFGSNFSPLANILIN